MSTLVDLLPEAELESLVDKLRPAPGSLGGLIDAILSGGSDEKSMAQRKDLPPEGVAELHLAAIQLCDEGRWRLAAPIALQLAMHMPEEPRFMFVAATCLQQLGEPHVAAALFAHSLEHAPLPATLLRLGECLAAAGERETARVAFEQTYEACRGHDEYRALQDRAAELLADAAA